MISDCATHVSYWCLSLPLSPFNYLTNSHCVISSIGKHICFFSAVCCECSDSKVSCLRHSHYMCRCSAKRKYILVWTPESEMNKAISRVEKRGEELNDATAPPITIDDLEDAASSSKDRVTHQTFEVSCNPICPLDSVPALVSSDSTTDGVVSTEPNHQPSFSSMLPFNGTAAVTPLRQPN